jgi:hypothetical protein
MSVVRSPLCESIAWGIEHRVRSQESEARIQEKSIKIDFIWVTASLNRRMSNKEFRISK